MEIFKLYGSVLIDTEKAMSSMQKLVGEADKFGTTIGEKFKSIGGSITHIGDQLVASGAKMTATITTPLAIIGKQALGIAGDVDKTMQLVRATMGATEEQAKKMGDAIERAASNSTLKVGDAANAMLNFARQGYTAEEAINLLEPAMALAVGTATDLDTVSSGLGNTLKAFGLTTKDSASVTDLLAKAQASANTTTSGLLDAISIAGPIFKAAGWDLDDLATVTGIFGDHSIEASEGANALKTGIARLLAPTGDLAIGWMKKLGLMTEDNTNLFINEDGTVKDFSTTLHMLNEKFSTLSESEQIQAANAIFGKMQMSKWLALINDGAPAFDALNQKILENAGYSQMLSDSLMTGLGGTIEKLKASFDVMLKNIGDSLGRVLVPVIEYITKLIDKFNSLSDKEQDQIVKIGLVVAAVGPLLMILGTLLGALGNIITFVGNVINIVGKIPGLLSNIGGLLGRIPTLLSKIGSIFTSTFGGIAMVIGGAITAIVSFVDMWKNGWSVIKTILEALGIAIAAIGAVLLGAPALVVAIVAAVLFALSQLAIVIHDHWEEIKQWASETWDNIKEGWNNLVEWIKEKWNEFTEWWTGLGDKIKEIWDNITGWIRDTWNNICDAILGFTDGLFTKIHEVVNKWFYNTFGSDGLLSGIPAIIHDGLDAIITFVQSAIGLVGDLIQDFFNILVDFFTGNFNKLKDDLAKLVFDIESRLTDIKISVDTFIRTVWNTVKDFVENAKNKVRDFINDILDKVRAFKDKAIQTLQELFDHAREKFSEMINLVREKISDIVDTVRDYLERIQEVAKEKIHAIFETIKEGVEKIIQGIKDFCQRVIDAIVELASNIVSKVSDFVSNIVDKIKSFGTTIWNAGKELIHQFWDGLKSVWEGVVAWVEDKFGGIVDKVKSIVDRVKEAADNVTGGLVSKISDAVSNMRSGSKRTSSSTSSTKRTNGSHAEGLDFVPFDGYVAELHKGERVLTKDENRNYTGGGDVVKAINDLTALVARSMAIQQDTLNNLNFNVNDREFARLVKAVQ